MLSVYYPDGAPQNLTSKLVAEFILTTLALFTMGVAVDEAGRTQMNQTSKSSPTRGVIITVLIVMVMIDLRTGDTDDGVIAVIVPGAFPTLQAATFDDDYPLIVKVRS